jgi:hypothetical protein
VRISQEQKDAVVSAYKSGVKVTDIQDQYGVSVTSISRILRASGVSRDRYEDSGYPEDLTGLTFSRLTVLGCVGRKGGGKLYECQCSCGKKTQVRSSHLIEGTTTSCGCWCRERAGATLAANNKKRATHAKCGTYLYSLWRNILTRCFDTNRKDYKDWGGRGITVHAEWLDDPRKFFVYIETVLGDRPTNKHLLDRIDNDGNYEPGNLRWASPAVSALNKRNRTTVEYRGQIKTVVEWAEIARAEGNTNLTASTLRQRLYKLHWTPERAITTPVTKLRKT